MTFTVDKVAVGQLFLPVPQHSPVNINPPHLSLTSKQTAITVFPYTALTN
jgi:hypothetical protein